MFIIYYAQCRNVYFCILSFKRNRKYSLIQYLPGGINGWNHTCLSWLCTILFSNLSHTEPDSWICIINYPAGNLSSDHVLKINHFLLSEMLLVSFLLQEVGRSVGLLTCKGCVYNNQAMASQPLIESVRWSGDVGGRKHLNCNSVVCTDYLVHH